MYLFKDLPLNTFTRLREKSMNIKVTINLRLLNLIHQRLNNQPPQLRLRNLPPRSLRPLHRNPIIIPSQPPKIPRSLKPRQFPPHKTTKFPITRSRTPLSQLHKLLSIRIIRHPHNRNLRHGLVLDQSIFKSPSGKCSLRHGSRRL